MDLSALAFVSGIALVTAFLFASAPVFVTSGLAVDSVLKEEGRSAAGSRGMRRRINLLIAGEVNGVVLLFGAGLFASSYLRLQQVPLGFDAQNLLSMRIAPTSPVATNPEALRSFYREVENKIQNVAGIREAALSADSPLNGAGRILLFRGDGPRPARGEETDSLVRVISPPDIFG